ncbi:hypothetical protein DOTSEDRAFT_44616 [Dothistroma septosporum NZE10]|uniref:fructose-bisphosphate aldolase n=1 Tax=Dothistroma septosporum (strain NZE10 / CBS 128990) TaxID=675120 RepID=N1PLJ3_DOTSN|nr:hypothetical protein DOTSEDRAFT_44616 [Dothistroma septosporum NZE10]
MSTCPSSLVPALTSLYGGFSDVESIECLHVINKRRLENSSVAPWALTSSVGRALQGVATQV